MRQRVGLIVGLAIALVLAGLGAALAVTMQQRPGGPDATSSPVSADVPEPRRSLPTLDAEGPEPPDEGAWLGAWVKPEHATPEGRLAAIADFERQLGRPLDIAHVYHKWEDPFPSSDDRALTDDGKILLLSWALDGTPGSDTRLIQAGREDELIRQRARAIKAWGAPILLEWRWEMDRPNVQAQVWSPADYIAAWKHLRGIFAEEGATNAAWVWCPLAVGFVDGRAQPFYPGDEHVDWICADVYPTKDIKPFAEAAGPFLEFARQHPTKPVIIGEYGMKKERGEGLRQGWLRQMHDFVKTVPQIKALVYFDADNSGRDEKPYDMSLRTAPQSMAVFRQMAHDPYFDVRRREASR